MKITIPLRGSDFEEDNHSYKLFLKEIVEFSENELFIKLIDDDVILKQNERPRIKELNFEVYEGNKSYDNEPKFAAELSKKHKFFNTEFICEYLVLNLKLKEDITTNFDYSIWSVNRFLTRLNFLLNLTYSTNIDFIYGTVYSDKKEYIGKTDIILSTIMFAYRHSRKIKWPNIKSIKLTDTIHWFHRYNIHSDHRSKNNLHRAINAFSYLFGNLKRERSADLFWIMLGIESLLVEGNQNITLQFREKSTIILGIPKEYKRKLNKLYEYRSKLIHGSFNIFPKHFSDYETFEVEYSDYLDFAVSILLALIRELIIAQKSKFEFELKLKE